MVFVGVDGSDSITKPQRALWEPMLQKLVTDLKPDDQIALIAIGSQTANAKPFFDGTAPTACPAPPLIACLADYRHRRAVFLQGAFAAIKSALAVDQASKSSDVFSFFDRVQGDRGRPLELWLFTDALNATAELNMERTPLDKSQFGSIIARLCSRHSWSSATLSGAAVQFILPSLAEGDKYPSPNSRVGVLAPFYTELISKLGGQLNNFETQPKESFNPQPKGGRQ